LPIVLFNNLPKQTETTAFHTYTHNKQKKTPKTQGKQV